MRLKGINYDIGTFTSPGVSSRETFDRAVVKREIEIIKKDLHCNAIRISGEDIERLSFAASCALEQGLEVWFSPAKHDADEATLLDYLHQCSVEAQKLRKISPNIVFVVGCELTFFMKGLVVGETAMDRIGAFMKPWKLLISAIKIGSFNKNLNTFLKKATDIVRENFEGKLTYASGVWEEVDWTAFDFIGIDYYWDPISKRNYVGKLEKYKAIGKPVVITEFGCSTYKGAEEKGGYGWAIVNRDKNPPELKGEYVRDETVQADLIKRLVEIYEAQSLEGAFVFTFVMPKYPYSKERKYDLDTAGYGVVKCLPEGKGTTYPDMPWEVKRSFKTLADLFK